MQYEPVVPSSRHCWSTPRSLAAYELVGGPLDLLQIEVKAIVRKVDILRKGLFRLPVCLLGNHRLRSPLEHIRLFVGEQAEEAADLLAIVASCGTLELGHGVGELRDDLVQGILLFRDALLREAASQQAHGPEQVPLHRAGGGGALLLLRIVQGLLEVLDHAVPLAGVNGTLEIAGKPPAASLDPGRVSEEERLGRRAIDGKGRGAGEPQHCCTSEACLHRVLKERTARRRVVSAHA
mmetsp:Transcript_14192/g.53331  ORF Transcript_14192/g.53331 Transcript_14192/m.53331 type:complete len:237 (+) Transcript_14192:74-784(+)